MSAVEYVQRAAWWSRELTRLRSRGPGDTANAMRSIGREYGLTYATIWKLRYRPTSIKDIGISIYARLAFAYYPECERQRAKLAAQIEQSHPRIDPLVLAASQALVGQSAGSAPQSPLHAQGVVADDKD